MVSLLVIVLRLSVNTDQNLVELFRQVERRRYAGRLATGIVSSFHMEPLGP